MEVCIMMDFLKCEKGNLDHYARQTWQVMSGRYALTEVDGLAYHVTIGPQRVVVTPLDQKENSFALPTVKFKALLEMFRI
jgi:hypothetical protein